MIQHIEHVKITIFHSLMSIIAVSNLWNPRNNVFFHQNFSSFSQACIVFFKIPLYPKHIISQNNYVSGKKTINIIQKCKHLHRKTVTLKGTCQYYMYKSSCNSLGFVHLTSPGPSENLILEYLLFYLFFIYFYHVFYQKKKQLFLYL